MFYDVFAYCQTKFSCERCGDSLYRVVPSNLLTCTNVGCDNDEPLFLVEPS